MPAQHNKVVAVDVIPEKVEMINKHVSPIRDDYIERYLTEKELDPAAKLNGAGAYRDTDFVVIAAPTNYDPQKNFFDTHHIEEVINLVLKGEPTSYHRVPISNTGTTFVANGTSERNPAPSIKKH